MRNVTSAKQSRPNRQAIKAAGWKSRPPYPFVMRLPMMIVWHIFSIQKRDSKDPNYFRRLEMRELTYAGGAKRRNMRTTLPTLCALLAMACLGQGTKIQGVVIDRNCAEDILKHGRQIILKQRRECSLLKNYVRDGYGILTDDHKFFHFDDAGNKKTLQLLKNTPDKDNLRVVVSGDLDGDTIKVTEMSLL
jgi:hypothetical protein